MNNPKEVLLGFFEEMHYWEVESSKLADEKGVGNIKSEVRDALLNIYNKFLLKPGGKNGRLAGPSVGYPPEYDEKNESIINIDNSNPKKIVIETLWVHPAISDFSKKQKYTLQQKDGGWKISKKEIFRAASEKWGNRVF